MVSVQSAVPSLPTDQQKRIYQLAGWLARGGVDDHECVLRFVQDAIPRLSEVRNLFAYYAPGGKARSVIEGHYRADCQERESKRWREEELAWARKLGAWRETA